MLYAMNSYGLQEKYYNIDRRFKNSQIPRIYDANISIAIYNAYNKIYDYGNKCKME